MLSDTFYKVLHRGITLYVSVEACHLRMPRLTQQQALIMRVDDLFQVSVDGQSLISMVS